MSTDLVDPEKPIDIGLGISTLSSIECEMQLLPIWGPSLSIVRAWLLSAVLGNSICLRGRVRNSHVAVGNFKKLDPFLRYGNFRDFFIIISDYFGAISGKVCGIIQISHSLASSGRVTKAYHNICQGNYKWHTKHHSLGIKNHTVAKEGLISRH